MNTFVVSQIFIAIAFVFDILSFQFRGRQAILICFIISSLLIGSHFFLLGKISASMLILLSTTRFTVAYFSKSPMWMMIFMIAACVILFITYNSPITLLAFVGSLISTFASFQANDKRLRVAMMCATSTWIIHNALIGSPAAVAMESFFLASNLVAYRRYYLKTTPCTPVAYIDAES